MIRPDKDKHIKNLQILSPLDFGNSWLDDEEWKLAKSKLSENYNWSEFNFSKFINADLEFYSGYDAVSKDLNLKKEFYGEEQVSCNSGDHTLSLSECKLVLSRSGICLTISNYILESSVSYADALHMYEVVSRRSFNDLYKSVVSSIREDINHVRKRGGSFERDLSFMRRSQVHWTHGVLIEKVSRGEEVSTREEIENFTLSESCYEYVTDKNLTRCGFGWEMTAISTECDTSEIEVKKLVWIAGFIWEDLYLFESLTLQKVSGLNQTLRGIRSRLVEARNFRTVVTTVIASATPANLTMVDRYVKILDLIMNQWRIEERKESLTGKVGLLEIMYSNMKDEESEYKSSKFNMYILILTVITVLDSLWSIVSNVNAEVSLITENHTLWLLPGIAFILFVTSYRRSE